MRDKLRSVRSHATGDSQGLRPVLSRFAAARTAVACREFVGAVVAASYRSCRDFARPALDYRIRNDLLFRLLMRIECECP